MLLGVNYYGVALGISTNFKILHNSFHPSKIPREPNSGKKVNLGLVHTIYPYKVSPAQATSVKL